MVTRAPSERSERSFLVLQHRLPEELCRSTHSPFIRSKNPVLDNSYHTTIPPVAHRQSHGMSFRLLHRRSHGMSFRLLHRRSHGMSFRLLHRRSHGMSFRLLLLPSTSSLRLRVAWPVLPCVLRLLHRPSVYFTAGRMACPEVKFGKGFEFTNIS